MTTCKCGGKSLHDYAPWVSVCDEVHTVQRCGRFTYLEARVSLKGGVLTVHWPDGSRTSTDGHTAEREMAKQRVLSVLEDLADKAQGDDKFMFNYAAKAVRGAR